MTDKQPEALSIANRLRNQQQPLSLALREKAAAELRRLYEVNTVMLDALNSIAAWGDGEVVGGWFDEPCSAQEARDAIAKVTGGGQ